MNEIYMRRAYELAKQGLGFTSPNPAVGAVMVKGKRILGEAYHKKAGALHAEPGAISKALRQGSAKGSDLYVTLEPCCHFGKTPPCVDAIRASGIRRVYIGMRDPSVKVNGKGVRALNNFGIQVIELNSSSILYKEIRRLNQPFIKYELWGLPYVVFKFASSLDGKIATRTGDSKWITGKIARRDARLERSLCDAVIVGAGTVRADNPELAAHGVYRSKHLLRVIIDPDLSLSTSARVFRDAHLFVACTDRASQKKMREFGSKGIAFRSFGAERVSVSKLLRYLGKIGIRKVFVEGGSAVLGSFFDAALKDRNMIDEVLSYTSPMLIGGLEAKGAIGGRGSTRLDQTLAFEDTSFALLGKDAKWRGTVNIY